MGPANEGLGNVIIWCPITGCYESTLNLSAQEGSVLNFDWMMALSLISVDSLGTTSRSITLSNNHSRLDTENEISNFMQNTIQNDHKMQLGPIRDITIDPLENLSRDISNYFVFENGQVADVVQPTYMDFNTSYREQTILGDREPGYYEYFVRAQTVDGLSDSSNVVSVSYTHLTLPTIYSV